VDLTKELGGNAPKRKTKRNGPEAKPCFGESFFDRRVGKLQQPR
jgi:hypothetical protein